MPRNDKHIPVNSMADNIGQGISLDRVVINKSNFKTARQYEEATRSHRDEGHTFHIVERGSIFIEIDFQKYKITAPSVVYMHQDQVHRILEFKNVVVCSLAINNEHINPEYLIFLAEIVPAQPLALTKTASEHILRVFSMCLNFSTLKDNRLSQLLLKDGCNTLIGVIASGFLNHNRSLGRVSRSESITRSFKQFLEKSYRTVKRPAEYAQSLNISTHYLNECVSKTTGMSVSQHIHDRIILEAKRLLYHTSKSVKEIAFDLGYEDYPYFSRLFTKAVGISALAFRNRNYD